VQKKDERDTSALFNPDNNRNLQQVVLGFGVGAVMIAGAIYGETNSLFPTPTLEQAMKAELEES
jgi:hypothetical protein